MRKADRYKATENVPASDQKWQQSLHSSSSPIKTSAEGRSDIAGKDPLVSTSSSDPHRLSLDYPGTGGDRGMISQDGNPAPDYISFDQSVDKGEFDDISLDAPLDTHALISHNADRPLCQEQKDLVELILGGKNVFYTGSAGCGKSEVLKCFRRCLSQLGKKVYTIAPTGKAALEINGSTAMSYVGWTPDSMQRPIRELENANSKYVRKRLRQTDVLVIDEVSMIENHFFERLNRVMKSVRCSNQAFGGVQIVVTGDFCQLPPVLPFQYCMECGKRLLEVGPKVKKCVNQNCDEDRNFQCDEMWAFCSDAWSKCDFVHVNLTTIHRQRDTKYINMLQKLRLRRSLSGEDQNLLLYHESNTEGAVKLFPKVDEVRDVNAKSFASLSTPIIQFTCLDDFHWRQNHTNIRTKGERSEDGSLKALEKHRYERQVQLRVGMLVVLLVNLNISEGLVNGSQGKIVGFEQHNQIPEQKGDHSEHKSTLINGFIDNSEVKEWPVVRFTNGRTVTIYPDCTINELGDFKPYSLLSRTQIPLMAAWAMTIHKAQGMTLSRVTVDLAKVFEPAHEYVALSRACSLGGLKVVRLSPNRNRKPDPQVKKFQWEKFGLIMGDEGEV